jgi:hypothetical protein
MMIPKREPSPQDQANDAWDEYVKTFDRESARRSGTYEPRRRAFIDGFLAGSAQR